ncbi:uncharacterized protein LOC132205328 [Neocloeon triangulifer]|uniref:uncharacterized protein LOC132205328 n=1 Tax=Neocloeon triangulifer TaxID=2078957 RepID=UPI00286F14AE|nr:uncharacterized protein LOC132205328 [Neocloeon triangulifer]
MARALFTTRRHLKMLLFGSLFIAVAASAGAHPDHNSLLLDGEELHMTRDANYQVLDRHKRYLMYPPMSIFQFTFLYALPFELMRNRNLVVVLGGQIAFDLPNNITRLTVQDIARQDIAQPSILKAAELILDQKGIPGKKCMLLAICELAKTPFEREAGLLEDILHMVLTPSEGAKDDGWASKSEMDEYLEAEYTGRDDIKPCVEAYPDCSYSILGAFSQLMFT